jgi:hypothetical protein
MNKLKYPHLFIKDAPTSSEYTNPIGGGRDFELPSRPSRVGHASKIRSALDNVWTASKQQGETRTAISVPTRNGTYIEFFSSPGYDLKFESLEYRPSGIRLLNVRDDIDEHGEKFQRATLFVPKGKETILINKVEKYRSEETDKGKPKNKTLIESVDDLRHAVLQSFWNDPTSLIPAVGEAAKCEIWLRVDQDPILRNQTVTSFMELCSSLELSISDSRIDFPERTILIGSLTLDALNELIASSDDIAEFRRAKETADFWTTLENASQAEWAEDLANRLSLDPTSEAVACVLDSGVNNGHPLLAPLLHDESCMTVDSDWGTSDTKGHGTNMCGAVAFGDSLGELLQSTGNVTIPFGMESVKLLPDEGYNELRLYGERTKQATSRAELMNTTPSRVICMAVTSLDTRDRGRPSSWSGAIDSIASGAEDDQRRLIILSGGNTSPDLWSNYPEASQMSEVHDPGQSWNALTVGAVTFKDHVSNEDLSERYSPIAKTGQLSPFSSTSILWETKWPNKPDIVLEGGNAAVDNVDSSFSTDLDDLSVLTTGHQPIKSVFSSIKATSAATAIATELAARIWAEYPEAWPETIRGLMVHSAQWTDQLKAQFWDSARSEKQNIQTLLRICGFGVPDLRRAQESATNSLSLVIESEITPFMKKPENNNFKAKDMHFYELPWPADALRDLPGDTPIQVDVTLSYFVEPGPGEIGWRDKYRYRSHGLDFNIKKPTEDLDDFVLRVNKAARDDDGDYGGGSVDWKIGPQMGRTRGSIHRDWVEMTAAEAVEANVVAVFPRTGWWKERSYLGKGENKTRYSLIVSVKSPEIEVDLYSPVAIKIAPPIAIST